MAVIIVVFIEVESLLVVLGCFLGLLALLSVHLGVVMLGN